jgi:hypothetical protein
MAKPLKKIFLFMLACDSCKHHTSDFSMNIAIKDIDYTTLTLDCTDCLPLPARAKGVVIERQSRYALPRVASVAINPNNNQEMIYAELIEEERQGFLHVVYHYNLGTRQRRLLLPPSEWSVLGGQISWHPNNWVLIPYRYRILKMKPNGDRLTLITKYESSTGAVWHPEGNKIAYYKDMSNEELWIVSAKEGRLLERVPFLPAHYDLFNWTKPKAFVRQRVDGSIMAYDIEAKKPQLLVAAQGSSAGFCWLDDYKTMVFATDSGLFITNTQSKQIKKMACSCQSVQYEFPVYVPKKRKIYVLKAVSMVTDPPRNNSVLTTVYLVQMNLDGSEEQIIELPK